jgi:hypothetical protein
MPRDCTCHDGLTCLPCYHAMLAVSQRTGFALPQLAPTPPAATSTQLQRRVEGYAKSMASTMTEAQLLACIRQLCKRLGHWYIYHTFCSKKSEPGFPDLVLVRAQSVAYSGRLIFSELKREGESPTLPQQKWLEAIGGSVEGVEHYIWRPSDLDNIVEILLKK